MRTTLLTVTVSYNHDMGQRIVLRVSYCDSLAAVTLLW